jgi:glycerophosphoryl diester phosphodiesterase
MSALSRLVGLVFLLVLLALPAAPAAGATPGPDPLVLNIGHRGASGLAPEHTLPAYDLALKLGADYIEQDLHMSADGVLVVIHDATLDRTARGPVENCTGPVGTKTLAQLKTCDVGSWFNAANPQLARPSYVGQRIPTLEEVFRRYGTRANYYIETKEPETAPLMEEELLRLMDKYGLRAPAVTRWQVLIQSFMPESLQEIHARDPSLPLVQLYPDSPREFILSTLPIAATYAVGVGPAKANVDAGVVAAAHGLCLAVHPYTVDEQPEMASLIAAGVDGMFTNRPDRLEAVLGANAAPAKHAGAWAAARSADCRAGS